MEDDLVKGTKSKKGKEATGDYKLLE